MFKKTGPMKNCKTILPQRIIAACGNDCSSCPRYTAHPFEKTEDELRHTAKLWMRIGYRDHVVSNREISCMGCTPENWCRYRVVKCCEDKGIKTCAECGEYPCDHIKECFEVTRSFEPKCREVCTEEEYRQLKKAFFEKEENLNHIKNRIDAGTDPERKNRTIGYRFNATGVFGYVFYSAGSYICTVSSIVSPSAPVVIRGNGLKWRSDFESCTIVPGLTRYIVDESNGKQIFRIIYKDTGIYEINESVSVRGDTGKYTFYCDDTIIAVIERTDGGSGAFQKPSGPYYDYEPYFAISSDDGISTELLMVILAFPMLRFAF